MGIAHWNGSEGGNNLIIAHRRDVLHLRRRSHGKRMRTTVLHRPRSDWSRGLVLWTRNKTHKVVATAAVKRASPVALQVSQWLIEAELVTETEAWVNEKRKWRLVNDSRIWSCKKKLLSFEFLLGERRRRLNNRKVRLFSYAINRGEEVRWVSLWRSVLSGDLVTKGR